MATALRAFADWLEQIVQMIQQAASGAGAAIGENPIVQLAAQVLNGQMSMEDAIGQAVSLAQTGQLSAADINALDDNLRAALQQQGPSDQLFVLAWLNFEAAQASAHMELVKWCGFTLLEAIPSSLLFMGLKARTCEAVLQTVQREQEAKLWAALMNEWGNALAQMPSGQRAQNIEDAIRCYKNALQVYTREQFPEQWAMTQNNLGAAYSDRILGERAQNIEDAIRCYKNALQVRTREQFPQDWAMTQNNLGLALRKRILGERAQNIEDAIRCLQQAAKMRVSLGLPYDALQSLRNLANLYFEETRYSEAIPHYQAARAQAEAIRMTAAMDPHRQMEILRENIGIYENLIVCFMKEHRYDEALEVAESGRSRTLLELLSLSEFKPENVPQETWDKYTQMRFRLANLYSTEAASAPQTSGSEGTPLPEDQRAALQAQLRKQRQQEIASARERAEKLQAQIRQAAPDSPLFAEPLMLEGMKRLAREAQATLVSFRVTAQGSYVFLIFPDESTQVVEVPDFTLARLNELLVKFENEEPVDGWVYRYYAARGNRTNETQRAWLDCIDQTLSTVYEELMKPVHEVLRDKTTSLVLVPNRGLAILPLHACWWMENGERCYLMDKYEIRYAPSLTLFDLMRKRTREAEGKLLGIANPTGDLTFSELECLRIEKIWGDGNSTILSGAQATKEAVVAHVGNRKNRLRMLHFACHGFYNPLMPMESALLLTEKEPLTLNEILTLLRLPDCRLVGLSACETAPLKFDEVADEQFGLSVGFLTVGAPTVWCSLWSVSDVSTALLMERAHELLKAGKSNAVALREAQEWLRKATAQEIASKLDAIQDDMGRPRMAWYDTSDTLHDMRTSLQESCPYEHPYHWAAFQCVGV